MRTAKDFEELLKALKPYLKEKYRVKEIGVFGSYIRGEQRQKSDLDILIDFEETPDLWTFIEIRDLLSKKLKVKIDLVMKSALKHHIGKNILKEVKYV